MPGIWDRYLDVNDAEVVLTALAVLETHRAVREPLPINDLHALLGRLRVVAGIAREEAAHWRFEAGERRLEASVDGGRWGSAATALRMAAVADGLADGSQAITDAAEAAIADLAPRLTPTRLDDLRAAESGTLRDIERLLDRARDW